MIQSYVWWPGIDQQIIDPIESLQSCLEAIKQPASLRPSRLLTLPKPWTRLHIDYAGPVHKMLVIPIDTT